MAYNVKIISVETRQYLTSISSPKTSGCKSMTSMPLHSLI